MNAARIVVLEQSSAYEDYDTENGTGHADDVEVVEVAVVEVEADDASQLDDMIAAELRDLGLDQWDGGNTAYDPDGSHMAPDGTITTRWARVERTHFENQMPAQKSSALEQASEDNARRLEYLEAPDH